MSGHLKNGENRTSSVWAKAYTTQNIKYSVWAKGEHDGVVMVIQSWEVDMIMCLGHGGVFIVIQCRVDQT